MADAVGIGEGDGLEACEIHVPRLSETDEPAQDAGHSFSGRHRRAATRREP
jgi:hypothetical protein